MSERRAAARIPFDAPARLITARGPLDARTENLSRVGVLLRIRLSALGPGRLAGLAQIAARVRSVLGASFIVELDRGRFTAAVGKASTLARVVEPAPGGKDLELGCVFDVPLSDREAHALGVSLPPFLGVSTTGVHEVGEPSGARTLTTVPTPPRRPSEEWRVLIAGTAIGAPPPLQGKLEDMSAQAVSVRLPRRAARIGPPGEVDAAHAAVAFANVFGDVVALSFSAGAQNLWAGRARVHGVELPTDDLETVLITFAFRDPLRPDELSRLGLA